MGHHQTSPNGYLAKRLNNHFDPAEIPAAKFDIDGDAQVAHANIAIATSHILGKGPGNSVQRDFLSQAFSDFIYAIIIEELGLVGGAFTALLYIVLLMRIGKIARNCDKPIMLTSSWASALSLPFRQCSI